MIDDWRFEGFQHTSSKIEITLHFASCSGDKVSITISQQEVMRALSPVVKKHLFKDEEGISVYK